MKITVLLFGIATDLVEKFSITIEVSENTNITSFKNILIAQHPKLKQMSSYAVAINESYATNETVIKENDLIAIIPPVSGG
ncbi:MoaD/ThiS family protein [Tenacibaculum soleae]|uniref:MoaD/ThiS family protein n=1 Tax=Tenacibaculum soleae TaxID=447689 RepID=UPI002300F508|nr:MoaD/ThiS family protein [Tenacibaculum soleae]